ncbi:GDSL-type esterase/lipase family protein [Clostridium sp.]|uniref:GDSL-type esterase/lipase family protein n=1 Tax=Clostridium sp. TaxID=1506 RepID=UPI0026278C80|nr:GDSL-type esterase/lipase family protein [uncultured Clostridium sp.]
MKVKNGYLKVGTVILVLGILIIGTIYREGGVGYTKYEVYAKTIYNKREFKNNQVTFLGDNIVDKCNLNALFNDANIVNEGKAWDTTIDILNRLDDVIKIKPKTLFLHIGINDLKQTKGQISKINIDKSMQNYSDIIKIIKTKLPNTKIYIESILPVDNNIIAQKYKSDKLYNFYISNDYIKVFNTNLKIIALENNVTYINHSTFNPTTETVDGIQPNVKGYFILKNDLQQYIYN